MRSDIFLSEIVDTRETDAGVIEVCAGAEGQFDAASSHLQMKLDAYLQNFSGDQFRPDWLPKPEVVREHVPRTEIHEVGRDIFQQWVRRVHASVPRTIPVGADGKPK